MALGANIPRVPFRVWTGPSDTRRFVVETERSFGIMEGTTIQMDAKKEAAKPTRRVFAPDQCHHRDAQGNPDCRRKKWKKNVNLCEAHEKVWQKEARERAKERTSQETPQAADVESVQKRK